MESNPHAQGHRFLITIPDRPGVAGKGVETEIPSRKTGGSTSSATSIVEKPANKGADEGGFLQKDNPRHPARRRVVGKERALASRKLVRFQT